MNMGVLFKWKNALHRLFFSFLLTTTFFSYVNPGISPRQWRTRLSNPRCYIFTHCLVQLFKFTSLVPDTPQRLVQILWPFLLWCLIFLIVGIREARAPRDEVSMGWLMFEASKYQWRSKGRDKKEDKEG